MGRSPCCSKEGGLNRGAWAAHEDKVLKEYIRLHGEGRWRNLPKKAGLKRCGKSCRLRWLNYLRPDIKRGNISSDEEELIIRLHKLLGNRWSLIAGRLPGRTDNEIKNYWNTNLGKKLKDSNQKTTNSSTRGNNSTVNPMLQLAPMTSTPLTPKLDSNVTITKATRCSKVLYLNPLPNPTMESKVVEAEETTLVDNSLVWNQMQSMINENEFLMDFNVDDHVLLSDLLINSDISNTYNDFFSCSDNNAENTNPDQLPTCSDGQVHPMFYAEFLLDYACIN